VSNGEKTTKSKRVRGSGSVFQKPGSRTYTIQYYRSGVKTRGGRPVLDGAGRPVPARIRVREATGFTSQRKAQDLLNERLSQVSRGEWIEPERRPVTIDDLFASHREHYIANGRPRTAKAQGWRWNHLKGAFSGTLAANLTTDAITRYILRRQQEGALSATINRELQALRAALNFGRKATPPKVKVVPHFPLLREDNVRTGFVEDAEFRKLTERVTELWLRVYVELSYTYGWRRGELLNLRIRNVDLLARTVRLDPGTTKNREGREVVMNDRVAELLRAAVAGKKPDGYVLTQPNGRRVQEFRRRWWSLCVAAGVGHFVCAGCGETVRGVEGKCAGCGSRKREYRGLIPHDLRRSAAKALRRAGVAESVVMAMGGWKTPAMFRRYAIVSSGDQRAAIEALDRAREENSPRTAPNPLESRIPSPRAKVQ
jgi:integrase